MYKNFLRAVSSNDVDSTAINDPFLCLQIRCPPGSYDVNIEPAKDDVLFEDPQLVLSLVKGLFGAAYGEPAGPVENKKPSDNGKEKPTGNDGFELLMARKSPPASSPRLDATSNATGPSIIPPEIFRKPPPSSRNFASRPRDDDDSSQNDPSEGRGLEALNPWSMTKLNAPFRTPMRTQAGPSTVPIIMNTSGKEPVRRHRGDNQESPASTRDSGLPSPSNSNAVSNSTSTSPPSSGLSPSIQHHPQASPTPSIQNHTERQRERDKERYGNGALDTWFERITQPSLRQNDVPGSGDEGQEPSLTDLALARFGSPNQSPSNNSESAGDIFTQDDIDDTQATPVPSLPLIQNPESPNEPDRAPQITHKRQELPVLERWSARLHQSSETQQTPGLEQALDFEHRKREAILKRREDMRNRAEPPSSAKSPHHSRYLSARAALNPQDNGQQSQNSVTPESSKSKPVLSPFDPRAYLIRQTAHQKELSKDGKAQRIQTSKLPLEKIPEDQDLHDVCLTIPLNASAFSGSVHKNMEHDLYTRCGTEAEAFMPSYPESLADLWRYRLSTLIAKKYNTGEAEVPSLDFDFSTIRHLLETE